MNTKRIFKAGIVQIDVKSGDTESNLRVALESIAFLASQNVNIAVLPEMWSCSFDNENLAVHAQQTPMILDQLSEAASHHHLIIAGSMPEISNGDIFNTLYVTDINGSIAGFYRKVHLFSLTGEEKYFRSGDKTVVCDTSIGPLGLMICYDLRFPELCRALALKGAQIVLVSAQWPRVRLSPWDILLQARAVENQLFIVAANRCGYENGVEFGGHSQIISPRGEIVVKAGNETAALYAELDFREIETCRKEIPSLTERVPEAYEF